MLFRLINATVRVTDLAVSLTVTICRNRSINPPATERSRNREWICTYSLNPSNPALVVVQLITDFTVCKVCKWHNRHRRVIAAPIVGDIVVVTRRPRTIAVAVLIILFEVNNLNLAIVTADVSAGAIAKIKVASIVNNQTVYDIRIRIRPANYTTTAMGYSTIDDDLYQTILDNSTISASSGKTTMSAISTRNCADNLNIGPAVANSTPDTSCNTCSKLVS